jgi:hypothetical protein
MSQSIKAACINSLRAAGAFHSPAYTAPSYHCEGVLLSAFLEPEVTPTFAAGKEDSRKAKATWQSASHCCPNPVEMPTAVY